MIRFEWYFYFLGDFELNKEKGVKSLWILRYIIWKNGRSCVIWMKYELFFYILDYVYVIEYKIRMIRFVW